MHAALLALALLLAPADSVRVSATLDPSTIPVGGTATLTILVRTGGPSPERIESPSLPAGLLVVGTRDFSQFQFSLPGGRTRVVRREITLRAYRPGRYTIPEIEVVVDGRAYRTRALELTATGSAPPSPPAPGEAASGPDDEVLFRATLAPDTAYVGQQITLRADAMISEEAQMRLRRAPEYLAPDAPGFWVRDFAPQPRAHPRPLGGRVYLTQTFTRAYFPITPGSYTLPPARLQYEIRRGFLYTPEREELVTDSLRVVVLPLPEEGRPDSFTGAVGRYRIRASIEPAEVPVGEAAALVVEIEGEGNIRALPPPSLPEMDGVVIHPPAEDATVREDGGRLVGTKRFTWILVPERPGRIELPDLSYAHFDPEARAYRVARTGALALNVTGTALASDDEPAARLAGLKARPGRESTLGWVRSPGFAVLQLVPLLGIVFVIVRGRRRTQPRKVGRRALRRRRAEAFARVRSHATSSSFLIELETLVRDALAERLDRSEITRATGDELTATLRDAGVTPETAAATVALLERIEHARFSPTAPGSAQRLALADEAERLMDAVDFEARTHAGQKGAVGASLPLLLIPGVLGAQDPEEAFRRGVEAYERAAWVEAGEAFSAYVQARPGDPNGWYNLGNTHFQTDARGYAIHAWLQALALDPRDRETRSNLAHARAHQALVRAAAPLGILSTDEVLLLAAIAWFAGAALIMTTYRRTRTRRGAAAGGVAILLAVGILAGLGAAYARGPLAIVTSPATTLHAAPTLRAEPLTQLEDGAALRVIGREGEWWRVRTMDGREGWVEAESVATLR